jgi:NAD(P)-dependent dehydrogenase (short-subunit alcohol dehydrogenase family)
MTRAGDRYRLDDRVAVITGGSSGLGVDLAITFADAGAKVVICGRRAPMLEQTRARVEAAGGQCLAVAADVSNVEQCEAVVNGARERFGSVDVLVNNAGVGTAVPALHETPEQFRQVLEVNLCGSYWMAQACGRVMRPGSSIVNVSSVLAATTAGLPQAAYSASKAAIEGLTRDLAQQWSARRGIRVNAIAPGLFESEMTQHYSAEYVENVIARVPLGRQGTGDEAAAAALFLACDAASYISGAVLPIDGGMLIA